MLRLFLDFDNFISCLTSSSFSSYCRVSSFAVFLSASPVQEVNNEKDEDGTKDLWALLEIIGVENDFLHVVYCHLLKNPTALKAFNGVPIHHRKKMLPNIVPDYQPRASKRNVKANKSSKERSPKVTDR
ncbi:uncharacterized protein LOC108343500 isoform X2 [Vigna angularis]|uniref:uncharacterized protein LOC108343500 isoform X2 n=1 Tax=Phaseolus angularis TaxID=3914 RepID=UPI0022B40103|nr:uncharacterized protein LOC108343500 isoform X2 [Vigna angularis]